jgi:hypothetical protein
MPFYTLTNLTTRLLIILGDSLAERFTAAITQEAFRLTLAEYSNATPLASTATHTVVTAGRDQDVSTSCPRLMVVTRVLYPYGDTPTPKRGLAGLEDYSLCWINAIPVLYIDGERVPAAGDRLRITYAAAHTLDNLDGAVKCTVPAQDHALLLQGASGHAAMIRSVNLTEAYTNRDKDASDLKNYAVETLKVFRAQIKTLGRQASRQPLPAGGFRLDQWDQG